MSSPRPSARATASVGVAVTWTIALPPRWAGSTPEWALKAWRENLSGVRKELDLRPVGDYIVAWRRVDPHFGQLGYEELALAIEMK